MLWCIMINLCLSPTIFILENHLDRPLFLNLALSIDNRRIVLNLQRYLTIPLEENSHSVICFIELIKLFQSPLVAGLLDLFGCLFYFEFVSKVNKRKTVTK